LHTHSIIPIDEMARSLNLFHDWFEIYPLLIFPIAVFDHGSDHEGFLRNPTNKVKGKSLFFDLGAYGGEYLDSGWVGNIYRDDAFKCFFPRCFTHVFLLVFLYLFYIVPGKVRRKEPWNAKACIRAMEQYTRDVGGYVGVFLSHLFSFNIHSIYPSAWNKNVFGFISLSSLPPSLPSSLPAINASTQTPS